MDQDFEVGLLAQAFRGYVETFEIKYKGNEYRIDADPTQFCIRVKPVIYPLAFEKLQRSNISICGALFTNWINSQNYERHELCT